MTFTRFTVGSRGQAIRAGLALLAVLPAMAVPAALAAQIPDTTLLSAARADALTGLYRFDDGALVHVMDLRDQFNGRQVLSVTEYGSGRVRALYPQPDSSFTAGSGWFSRSPVQYHLRFGESRGRAETLKWTEAGAMRTATRVKLVERDVAIRNDSIVLAGTLVLPPGPGPHPLVVMVHGSGPITRRSPRQVGDLLAARGVAVLVTDKRGTGGSGGNWNALSHRTWASDVDAQLDFAKRQPGIDSMRMGLFAASEGGFVAPLVASRRADVRFLVCRVCSALPHAPVILDSEGGVMRRRGWSDTSVTKALELLARTQRYSLDGTGYDSLVAFAESGNGSDWRTALPLRQVPPRDARYWATYRGVLDIDPATFYRQLRIPILAILGERDDRVLVERHRPVFESFAANDRKVDVWVIPDATHGLLVGSDASAYPAGLHDRLADWIARATGVRTTTTPPR